MMWKRSALIADIDNTLFDWLHFWQAAFGAMVESILSSAPDLSRDRLLEEVRTIHRRFGTAEYAFLLQDLRPLLSSFGVGEDGERRAIQAYREAREATLHLYPDTKTVLTAVKRRGSKIIGFTESTGFHTMYRIRKLGLDGTIHAVYSPPDHAIPSGVDISAVRTREPLRYTLEHTRHEVVPDGFKKPDPVLLETILTREGIRTEDAVYVGDSLVRDVAMAQGARVLDAYAQYGKRSVTGAAELLLSVSHWSDAEIAAHTAVPVVPSIVLDTSLTQIFGYVQFGRFADAR